MKSVTKAIQTFPIAIVASEFNYKISQLLLDGALGETKRLGFSQKEISVFSVPGAIEIPIISRKLAQTRKFNVIVGLGVVIRGETTHYESVVFQVSYGCQYVALKEKIPVIFGILTTETEEQALERCGGSGGHKGIEAIHAAVKMNDVLKKIDAL